MRAFARWSGTTAFTLSLTAVAVAQAPALDVKMGLWELTSVSEVGGQMPGYDTSKMTADQKAKMDEAMKAIMGKHTSTDTTCMTKEKFDMHIDALSTTAFKATFKSSNTDQGKTMTVNVDMTGKWLGASCGDKK